MERHRTPRRRPDAPSFAPTTLHEITRRYYATAVALAKAMGLPMSETFMREHRESISCCFIEAGRAGVRLPLAVQLPPLADAPVPPPIAPNGEAPEAGEIMGSLMPPAPEAPTSNGHTPPVAVPADSGLPCGGQAISALKPASLSMVINKVAALMHGADRDRWVPLLAALQAERAGRLARGRKAPRED